MLAVFLQVLVVAVLGLGAITRDRQEARRSAELEAQEDAEDALGAILAGAAAEIRQALLDLREYPDFDDIELLRSGGGHGQHGDLLGPAWQIDPQTNVIYWMDGDLRLYVPTERRAALIAQSKEPEQEANADAWYDRYRDAPPGAGRRIQYGLLFCEHFPWRLDRETGYAQALGCVLNLVDEASEAASLLPSDRDADAAFLDLERVLLRATEVVALNEDRAEELDVGDLAKLRDVPSAVEAAITARPERESLRRHVEAVRQARRLLAGNLPETRSLRPLLEVARRKIGNTESVTLEGDHLFGLIPGIGEHARDMVVLLSLPAARHLVETLPDPGRLERLGLALHLVSVDEPTPDEADVAVSQDLRQVPGLSLPYRAELHRTREVSLPGEGPGELFYWSIIGLSAAGLGMGGWVLMRLYTREVRLARLKADFVSNLSHELKTPLTSIAMFAEMLQGGQLASDEDRLEGITILAQEAERLQGIVHRMLDTAKREARGVDYVLEPGDLNEVVGKAAERFERIVTEPGLDLTVALESGAVPIRMDRAAIDDVVTNLVSNAWKYKRGSAARVEVRTARRGRSAEITVADDGLGIPRAERRKVFEMFYRADAYLTRAAGTGLGLSLVRTIVKAHRGTVRIETGLDGRGSLFRIRLPLTKAAVAAATAMSEPDDSMSPRPEAEATS